MTHSFLKQKIFAHQNIVILFLKFISIIKWKQTFSLNATCNFCALKNLQLRFQEKNLNLNRHSNLGSPDHYPGAWLVIWRSEVRIPVQVQIFLLKSKLKFMCYFLSLNFRSGLWNPLNHYCVNVFTQICLGEPYLLPSFEVKSLLYSVICGLLFLNCQYHNSSLFRTLKICYFIIIFSCVIYF